MLKFFPNSPKKLINKVCYPQNKGRNYFQAEGPKLLEKGTQRFQILFEENMKILIKTLTVSIYLNFT